MRLSATVPAFIAGGAILLSACAKRPDEITAAYVSPLNYDLYTCEQLAAEAQRVSARAGQVMGVQQQRANNDAAAVGVGLILFWPALFFVRGGAETEQEVARLKGEMDAIEQAAIQKQCGFTFERPEPVAPPPPPRSSSVPS